jgi:hypothetical protein
MADIIDTFSLIWFAIGMMVMASIYMFYPALCRNDGFTDFLTNSGYPTNQECKMPLTSPNPMNSGPADATITDQRTPYHLLGDYMESGPERLSTLKSENVYMTDTERLIERTGSYGQVTNNNKHKTPDNGSAWMRELVLSFYKV